MMISDILKPKDLSELSDMMIDIIRGHYENSELDFKPDIKIGRRCTKEKMFYDSLPIKIESTSFCYISSTKRIPLRMEIVKFLQDFYKIDFNKLNSDNNEVFERIAIPNRINFVMVTYPTQKVIIRHLGYGKFDVWFDLEHLLEVNRMLRRNKIDGLMDDLSKQINTIKGIYAEPQRRIQIP